MAAESRPEPDADDTPDGTQAPPDRPDTPAAADRIVWLLVSAIAPLVLAVIALAAFVVVLAVRDDPAAASAAVNIPRPPAPLAAAPVEAEPPGPAPAPTPPEVSLEAADDTAEASPLPEADPLPVAAIHTVIYTSDGFDPEQLSIAAGDTVLFVNASGGDFWPASNIHPSHEILPEFDALMPVAPGQTWQFIFDEPGEWRYHDHLNADEGGLISVAAAAAADEEPPQPRPAADPDSPLALTDLDRQYEPLNEADYDLHVGIYTDDEALDVFLDRYGPTAALEVVQYVDANADLCHDRAHDIGRIAYEKVGAAAFALSSHECRSGGFHGAIEALFAERGTANLTEDVRVLCSVAENPFMRHQCLHGVGHGVMAWTNYELHQALDLCSQVPGGSVDQGSCYGGVYMENVVGGLSGVMGHITEYLRDDDPVYPCNVVKPQYQPDCYLFQTSRMVEVLSWDFAAVGELCDEAPPSSRLSCWSSFGRDASSFSHLDPASSISLCQHANNNPVHHEACLTGAVQNGFWERRGADRSVAFCKMLSDDPAYTPRIVNACYQTIVGRARNLFPTPLERQPFCDALPEAQRQTCL